MSKNNYYPLKSERESINYCNSVANQYIIMVSIFAAIISQEIEDDEQLGILGTFLISLGEELSLASEVRIVCKEKLENATSLSQEGEGVFIRSPKKIKKIKRRTKYKK